MAPSARAVQKAEAKYGVTADYPDLQLHAAAANGNVGLVKYALMHGQPVNSVLNGVLPIHIAASSGNDMVVQMLLDAGADVNAARLPRKYNADRSKAISSIGAAGSTPLHFAAANGHAHIVSLLLSHGANPDVTEKHGLTPEDLAREAGHVNVVTVFRLWKQDQEATDHSSEAGHSQYLGNEFYSSPPSASGSGYSGGGKLASSAASIHSVASATGRKLLSKPSLDSISNKGKKLAKAASNPNLAGLLPLSSSSRQASNNGGPSNSQSPPYALASSFAQPPVALRQNPSKALANYMQNHPNAPLIHHVINLDKSRRPSLPSVFEKAAHPSQSIKSALGLSSHANSARLGSRGGAASGQDHDPYRLARPQRSSSKTSLSGLFKGHQHNKEKSTESYSSQPLSPTASTFFTGDDELDQAERDVFLRTDGHSDNESGQYRLPFSGAPTTRPGIGSLDAGRASIEGFTNARSRAGSASSAATSQSNVSYAPRGQDTRSLFNYPSTAPPTQTTFTNSETELPHSGYTARPVLSAHNSTGSIVIPQPIPPPPSSSTQPFFSKAAISAAHNNNTARPGFYRPRKSSQLSTAASAVSNTNYTVSSPEHDNGSLFHQSRPAGASNDAEASTEGQSGGSTLVPPALIIRRPTVRDGSTSQGIEGSMRSMVMGTTSPRQGASEPVIAVSPPSNAHGRSTQTYNSNGSRHSRTISDGTGSIWPVPTLPDVQESPESQIRPSNREQISPSQPAARAAGNEIDRDGRRESEDVFPPPAEAPFTTRSRAGSRARVDSAGSSGGSVPYFHITGATSHQSPSLAGLANFQQHQPGADSESHWRAVTRAHRSDSTTTDTRTSRSGSVGESGGQHHRFFGFDYSSSPTGSTASFKYHPSASTTATSLVSSPPGTAISGGLGTTVTHSQAQHMVKKKEEELLSYDPSEASEGSSARRPSLSQQLAAYGDSLAIERELHDAEQYRQNPHERIALTIPEPPASAKYSWEILGKESRTNMPVSKGQRAREKHEPPSSVAQQQKLWTHRMVSPYEVPLNRPGTHFGGHRHTPSTGTITSSGKPLTRVVSNESTGPPNERLPSIPQSPALPAIQHPGEHGLRNKPSSTLSLSRGYLAPPQQSGGSDMSVKKSPRMRSVSPNYTTSPRSSTERDRERPSATYHVVAGPGSEPNDSANSSLVSEPRSGLRPHGHGGSSTVTIGSRHRHHRSESHSASPSPDTSHALDEHTPRPPQLLRLETVMAPKFHVEQKAGGEAAPSPTKPKFGSKFGKLFR